MISREDRGSVAVLRMEHGKVNAIDVDLFTELRGQLEEVERSATAVVLTGAGKAFSAGVDLFRVLEGGKDYLQRFLPVLMLGLEKLFLFPKPVVAAINGHAIAGGCIMACACDYRVGAESDALMGVPELLVGVPFPPLALEIARSAVSHSHLQEIVYTGRYYSMEQALRRGMVDETVSAEALLTRACEVAEQFGNIPSRAFQIAKRQIRQPYVDHAKRFGESDDEILKQWSASETHEVIRKYLQKTVGKR